MTNKLSKLLASRGVLLADGATGTNLFGMGLQTGDAPELWNIDHPDRTNHSSMPVPISFLPTVLVARTTG
jgi:methionine synthase I (cobalamin-dependent)